MSGKVKGLPILFAVNILSNLIFLKIFFSLFFYCIFLEKPPWREVNKILYCILLFMEQLKW